MNLSASDTGVAVHVLAERAETVDLMRRNIDILTREFQNLGYQNISFSFAEGQRRDAASTGTPDPVPEKEAPALRLDLDAITLASNVPGGVAAGLDIRL
jgi:hypothetical protein